MRGSRVQAVVNELQGERIDIIPWTDDAASFIVNALQPAEVTKVVMDQDENRIEVVVPDEQLSLAIGRRGQNVRLASQLSGWSIDIMTEEQESERRQKEFAERSELFMTSKALTKRRLKSFRNAPVNTSRKLPTSKTLSVKLQALKTACWTLKALPCPWLWPLVKMKS